MGFFLDAFGYIINRTHNITTEEIYMSLSGEHRNLSMLRDEVKILTRRQVENVYDYLMDIQDKWDETEINRYERLANAFLEFPTDKINIMSWYEEHHKNKDAISHYDEIPDVDWFEARNNFRVAVAIKVLEHWKLYGSFKYPHSL